MTQEQREVIEALRAAGYAVTVFSPEELGTMPARTLEEAQIAWSNEELEHWA